MIHTVLKMFLFLSIIGGSLGFAQSADIFVSNYPLSYFAERILAKNVYFPDIDGDPAFWEPREEEIAKLQAADIIILNGADYEKWQTVVSLPLSKVVETAEGFKDQFIVVQDEVNHSHGEAGEHSHKGIAFTTWLDFNQALMQAEAIKDALIDAEIAAEEILNENFQALKLELLSLDQELLAITKGQGNQVLIASHPVYQYLARRYGLDIIAVHWEPDVYPSEELWQELELLLAEHSTSWFIWEGQALEKSVNRLESMGIKSIVFDPGANRPEEGNFLSLMRTNIEHLRLLFEAD